MMDAVTTTSRCFAGGVSRQRLRRHGPHGADDRRSGKAGIDARRVHWHPTQLVAGRRVQCPASNSMGRVVGPVIPMMVFQGAGRCGGGWACGA